jgi:lambda family phage tail tape measure protein
MASQNIARLGVVLGLDTAEFTASIDKAISENAKLKNAIRRDTNAAAGELINLKNATDDYGKTLTKVQMMERETTSGRFMNATKEMKAQLLEKAKAYDAVANAAKNATNAEFKMNAQQKMGLTYQTTDLVTSLAAGQNPFIVLLQQGGQLKDQMGGLGNMFKAIGTLLTPMRLAIGGVTAAFGTLAYAAYAGREEFDKLRDTITLTGNYAGVTTKQFYELSSELSNRTNYSIGATKDALSAVLATGKFTAQSIGSVTQAVIQYAQIAGVDAKTAADKLTSGLDGSAAGAKALNKEMNFLTVEQYKQIEALEEAGKKQEAAKVAADALNTQLMAQRRELGLIDKAWESTTNALSKFWNLLKEIGKPETTEQVIAQLDRQIQAVQEALGKNTGDSPFEKEQRKQLQLLKEQREAILETERLKARSAAARDVGGAKENIEDYEKAGGLAKVKQITMATEKLKADIKYTTSLASLNEIEKIEAEAQKAIAEKRAEFENKSGAEKRAMGGLLAKQLAQEELDIEAKKNEKIRLIRQKEKIDINKYQMDEQKQAEDASNQFAIAQAYKRQAALEKTQSLEMDKEELQLKQQMIYASEKELQLAQLALKYKRLREADGSNLDQLKQQEAIEKFNIETRDAMKKTSEVFDSVWGNMSSAIDNFVKTGKLSMKDFARSVIQDLIAIQMKAAALSILRMMFGGNPLASSSYGYSGGLEEHVFNPGQRRASGGSVTNNTPYLVGEKGPELFMPSGSGTIIPNNEVSQMGGVTNVTNNYINAIDTKSFEERLLGSSSAIWAANKYGEKNLSTNYGRT